MCAFVCPFLFKIRFMKRENNVSKLNLYITLRFNSVQNNEFRSIKTNVRYCAVRSVYIILLERTRVNRIDTYGVSCAPPVKRVNINVIDKII